MDSRENVLRMSVVDGNGLPRGVGGSPSPQVFRNGADVAPGDAVGGGRGLDRGILEVFSNLNDSMVQFRVMVGMGWGWTGGSWRPFLIFMILQLYDHRSPSCLLWLCPPHRQGMHRAIPAARWDSHSNSRAALWLPKAQQNVSNPFHSSMTFKDPHNPTLLWLYDP